jgi:peptidoglycan/xylan/chitin deacetylase (PgdA/CDA1 family)
VPRADHVTPDDAETLTMPGLQKRLHTALEALPPGARHRLRLLARSWRLPFVGRGAILLYHRVTELANDPWTLAVPPKAFADQMAMLARHTTCLPLTEFLKRRAEGSLPRNATAVTFDDGYADNLKEALPLLERHGIPATVFILTGFVGGEMEPWWDRLEQAVFATRDLPDRLELAVEDARVSWTRPAELDHADRLALHLMLYEAVIGLDSEPREAALLQLWRQLGTAPKLRPSHRALTLDELHELAAHELITIGAHTRSHPQLAAIPADRQAEELATSKATLETWLGRTVDLVAYPHGAHDETTCRLAAELGFRAGFTTEPRVVPHRLAPFRIPRINIEAQDSQSFAAQLRWYGVVGRSALHELQ